MAIRNNYNKYKEIFNRYNININDSEKYLGRVKKYETIAKMILFITLTILATFLCFEFTRIGKTGNIALVVGIMSLFVLIVGSSLWSLFNSIKKSKIAKLDDLIFNKFLINKIKIFYSVDELKGSIYDKMEHINTRAYAEGNLNQAVIDLAFIAFEKGAEGIIIVSNNNETVTTTTINNKGSSTQFNKMVNSAEAILIKNIKQEELKKEIESFDLNYWYDLKEKGAITQEEYESKKQELLNKN